MTSVYSPFDFRKFHTKIVELSNNNQNGIARALNEKCFRLDPEKNNVSIRTPTVRDGYTTVTSFTFVRSFERKDQTHALHSLYTHKYKPWSTERESRRMVAQGRDA